jgi:hypothetical protein
LNKRILVPLVLPALAVLALTACGGGSSDEDKITETIETWATTGGPHICTELETQRFVEQNSQEKGKVALKTCEKEAAGEEKAESAEVSNVSLDGEKATAQVAFKGGNLGSQALEIALVEEDGEWKIDFVEGFANYDGKALGEAFQRQFEVEGSELSSEQLTCIGGKIAGLSQSEAEEVFFGGSTGPIIELAQSCG